MLTAAVIVLQLCTIGAQAEQGTSCAYLDYSDRDDLLSGGVKMIPVTTPKGAFRVWTKRIGNSPTMKVLLLHGGPGFTTATNPTIRSCGTSRDS
jgi:proline iminopeptidase